MIEVKGSRREASARETRRAVVAAATELFVEQGWAGTTVDHGCFAPVAPFVDAFALHGVTITSAESRGSMGLGKRDHIRALTRCPRLRNDGATRTTRRRPSAALGGGCPEAPVLREESSVASMSTFGRDNRTAMCRSPLPSGAITRRPSNMIV